MACSTSSVISAVSAACSCVGTVVVFRSVCISSSVVLLWSVLKFGSSVRLRIVDRTCLKMLAFLVPSVTISFSWKSGVSDFWLEPVIVLKVHQKREGCLWSKFLQVSIHLLLQNSRRCSLTKLLTGLYLTFSQSRCSGWWGLGRWLTCNCGGNYSLVAMGPTHCLYYRYPLLVPYVTWIIIWPARILQSDDK